MRPFLYVALSEYRQEYSKALCLARTHRFHNDTTELPPYYG